MSDTATPDPLLRVIDLKKHFPGSPPIKAVDGVSFEVYPRETLSVVGESGCGKSTTGRAVLQLHRPSSGTVYLGDIELTALDEEELRRLRPRMQMIFQDSYASLNPRHTVGRIIGEPMRVHTKMTRAEVTARTLELLDLVGLRPAHRSRYPHEFSGGQRQRINIARALALNPELVVCDEPISALDVSIQAQVINLFSDLQDQLGLAYLFVAHDLSMVQHISDRVAVMYLGHIVELAATDNLFSRTLHPYTQALLSAVPIPEPEVQRSRKRVPLEGELPSPQFPPSGCVFSTRCPLAFERCSTEIPALREISPGHQVACHLADDQGSSIVQVTI
jgi:oligopeptide/dipeptide ABC transporter ATP-binding protein